MRILHFSDFHLCLSQRSRAIGLVNRMIDTLLPINSEQKIDLIIFSGDLVDQGGKEYASLTDAFEDFRKVVIDPICEALNLEKGRFVFSPGNHDINQNADTEEDEKKIFDALTGINEIDQFMHDQAKVDKIYRIKDFNEFQSQYLKSCGINYQQTAFQTNLSLEINHETVGITCLNTSWRCFNSCQDKGRIVMGKSQVTDSIDQIRSADIKIAIGHHYYDFLNPIECNSVADVIANNYDLYMGGHTHGREGHYEIRPAGSCMFLTASGTVYSNISDKDNQNGFILVDYLNDKREVQIRWYKQNTIDGSFNIENNYAENGVSTVQLKGFPIFKPVWSSLMQKKWPSGYENNPIAELVIKDLSDPNIRTLQLVALSGLGKTRILYEAFETRRMPKNSFYCDFSDKYEGVVYEAEQIFQKYRGEDGLLIIDNCPNQLFLDVRDRRESYNSDFRLIGINNEYFDRISIDPSNCKQIFLSHNEFKECADKIVDGAIPDVNGDTSIREKIKKIADGFPGMACDLVEGFKVAGDVDIHIVDRILSKLLKLEEADKREQMIVMETLSLFQPCPYKDINKEAYEVIRDSDNITPLYRCGKPERRQLFSDVIKRYSESLIDSTRTWVNVRPLPLAIWLVGKWFDKCDEERLDDVLNELKNQPEPIYKILRDGLCKRIEYMQDNYSAQELLARLTEKEGSFYNEKVICSDMGSRLFLAMSSVNPVTRSVAKCLYDNLLNKDIQWITLNVKDDVRRNLVWALEKLCFDGKSYEYAVKVMALFAVAENEEWSNNAEGKIKQLFHIQLPGTVATLEERLQTIKDLSTQGNEYVKLTMDIIDHAWMNGGFHRDGFCGKFGLEQLIDYRPKTNKEVAEYWTACGSIMVVLLNQHEDMLNYAADIVKNHIFRWSFDGMLQRMMPLIISVSKSKSYIWDDAWQELTRCRKKYARIYSEIFIKELDVSIAAIAPRMFVGKLREAMTTVYDRYSISAEETLKLEDDLFKPLAVEFVKNGIYKDKAEVRAIFNDKEFRGHYFCRVLRDAFDESRRQEFFNVVLEIIKTEGGDVYKNDMYFMICYQFRDYESIQRFFDQLLNEEYKNLYIRTTSHCETENLKIYAMLKKKYEQGAIGISYAEDYLNFVSISDINQTLSTIKVYHKEQPDQKHNLMNFIIRHRFRFDHFDDETFDIVKACILDFEIDEDTGHQNYEYSRFVVDLLEKRHDDDFASKVMKKVIQSMNGKYLHGNLEGIVSTLLKEYTNCVWDDFVEAFVSDDHVAFWYQIRHELGSGTGFGSGPLFQLGDERIKDICLKYPDKAPAKLADMIPVFKYSENGCLNEFSDMFLWMLDNFASDEFVLSGLHGNLGTYGWTGSVIPLIQQKKECFEKIKMHPRLEVRSWVSACLAELEEEYQFEDNREQYMRLHYQ